MTDPTTVPAAPVPAPKSDAQKSPLDVLEEILNESKGSSGGPAVDPAAAKAAAEAQAAAEAAKAEAEAMAKVQADMERQRLEDQQKLKEQITDLKTIKDTPAYQARVAQDEEKKQEAAATAVAGAGYEIVQLDHTKV